MKAKYKIGQTVFHMSDNSVYECLVVGIIVTANKSVYYKLSYDVDSGSEVESSEELGRPYNWDAEDTIFPTKEALIASL